MKTSFFAIVLSFVCFAMAPSTFGLEEYPDLRAADTIYLVRIFAIDPKKVAFSVIETLRGTSAKFVVLNASGSMGRPYMGWQPNDEALIFSLYADRNGENGNWLGTYAKGWTPGWQCASVRREGPDTYVGCVWMDDDSKFDARIDGGRYVTLAHLKQLLNSN